MAFAPDSAGSSTRHWTVDEYMQLDDDRRFEVLRGELTMVPSPTFRHQRSIAQLGRLIDTYVRERELGECVYAPLDVVLADDTVVQPDFVYVRSERFDDLYDGHGLSGAPDMVVEVLSPGTESRDRHHKRDLYAEAGVEWLLFVEPEERLVEVFRLDEEGRYVVDTTASEDDTLSFDLFADLAIDLSEVWFEPPETSE